MQLRKEAYHGQHKRGNERNGRSGHRGVEHDWSVRQRYCAERDEVEQQQQRQQDVQGRKRPGWAAVLFARARLWRTHTHRRTGGADTQGSIEKGAFWRRHVFFCPWSKNGAIGSNVGWLQWRPPVTRRQCTGALRALRPGESALGLGDSLFALRTRPGSAYVLPSRELLHSCI